jgi:hypothetical protein
MIWIGCVRLWFWLSPVRVRSTTLSKSLAESKLHLPLDGRECSSKAWLSRNFAQFRSCHVNGVAPCPIARSHLPTVSTPKQAKQSSPTTTRGVRAAALFCHPPSQDVDRLHGPRPWPEVFVQALPGRASAQPAFATPGKRGEVAARQRADRLVRWQSGSTSRHSSVSPIGRNVSLIKVSKEPGESPGSFYVTATRGDYTANDVACCESTQDQAALPCNACIRG